MKGGSRREWLRSYIRDIEDDKQERRASEVRASMRGPQCPVLLSHLMGWFYQLSATREWGEAGPKPIKPSEIEAWARLTGTAVSVGDAKALLDIDILYRNVCAEDESESYKWPEDDQIMVAWASTAIQSKNNVAQ